MNGCRQNGRVQTADKNIIIHTTPVHQWMSCFLQTSSFSHQKNIYFNFKPLLQAKMGVHNPYHNYRFLQCSSRSHQNPICFCAAFNYKWCLICAYFTEESNIMDLYFSQKQQFEVKKHLKMDLFITKCIFSLHKTIINGLEWCGLIVMFLSTVWAHSDGTHSLQRIHWWTSNVNVVSFCSNFWVKYSFKR